MLRIHLLLLSLSCFLFAFAKENIGIQPEPAWLHRVPADLNKKPEAGEISDGYYYELMDKQVNLVNQTKYTHFIRQIVNESGVQNASEVSVYFAPQFQRVIFHKLLLIRNGKKLNRLAAGEIKVVEEETEASNYEYTGIKRAYVTLKDVQKGDQVEVAYSLIGFNPVFSGRYSEEYYFNSQTPILNYFLTILTAPRQKLYIKTFNQAPDAVRQTEGPFEIYQWNNPGIKIGQEDSNSPSWFTADPYVAITEYENWGEVVDWGLKKFNNYHYEIPHELENRIAEWRKMAQGDPDMLANLALRFVQDQVRYLGLEIGTYTHQPHPPAEVYNHRFGDCKDKALLLAAILNQEQIPSYVALVNTEAREKLAETLPAPTDFDHAIVAIKRSAGYIFVDPTISMQRGELINSFIPAYGFALVIRQGETDLRPVDPGFLYNTSVTESADVRISDSTLFSVKTIYAGGAADDARSYFASASQKEIADSYTKYYAGIFEGIGLLRPVRIADDSLKNEMEVDEAYGIPRIWHRDESGKKEFGVFAKVLSSRIPDPTSGDGGSPIALTYPQTFQYTLALKMPIDFPGNMKGFHVKNPSYQFDFTPEEKGKQLTYHYSYKTFSDNIPVGDIPQYKKDYKEISNCLSLNFSRNDLSGPESSSPAAGLPSGLNRVTMWVAFFFGVFFTALFRYLNRGTIVQDYPETGWPLGGWTLVLGITIGLKILVQAYVSWQQHYFQQSVWIALDNLGGSGLQGMLVFELLMALFSLAGAGALLYWFLNRRDIFPKMFIYYIGVLLGLQLVQIYLYNLFSSSIGSLASDLPSNLFKSVVYALIWITYVLKSERVRNTFVVPPDA